jgi:hypothetical protein
MSYWSQVNNEFFDHDGFVCIDAWETEDDNEEGKVIAKIDVTNGNVTYLDERAKNDSLAKENINEVVTRIKTFLGLQTIATAKFLSEYDDDRNFIGED